MSCKHGINFPIYLSQTLCTTYLYNVLVSLSYMGPGCSVALSTEPPTFQTLMCLKGRVQGLANQSEIPKPSTV